MPPPPPPAPVPFSQLKLYTHYIVPAPSDEARFLTATFARNADEYLKKQRRLLLRYVGRKMHLLDRGETSFHAQLKGDGVERETVYFDETSFPPGQMFQEVNSIWKPVAVAPLPPDPWDEFIDPLEMDFASDAAEKEYYKKNPPVKLRNVLSPVDLAALNQFQSTLDDAEIRALNAYRGSRHSFMGPLMLGLTTESLGVVNFARSETLADSKDPARPPLPKERPGPGFIREFMTGFLTTLSRAPKLTQEINVFRGIVGKEALNIDGTLVISTSYNKHVAFTFSNGRGMCCMLKINVKPGVRFFAWRGSDDESEIMVLPPYKALIEDIDGPDSGVKKVTIIPVKYRGGTRGLRTRRLARKQKKQTRRSYTGGS
jgi:hypothetical protein